MSQSGDKRDVRILGIYDQASDRMCVRQSDELPSLTRVNRLIDSISANDIAADASFARADIDDVGIGFGHGERTDGGRSVLLLVKERLPIETTDRKSTCLNSSHIPLSR